MKRLTLLFCFILFFTAATFAIPIGTTIYVNASAAPGGDGTSWAAAFTSLQDALNIAGFNDRIWVAAGTYTPSAEVGGVGDRYKAFQLINNVSIYGGFAGTETDLSERTNLTIIANPTLLSGEIGDPGTDADNCYHVIYNTEVLALDGSALLDGFVITDGTANDAITPPNNIGGGIFNDVCSPTIMNCTIIGCSADFGGGIFNEGSSSEITNCLFLNNISNSAGGAVFNYNSSSIITNSIFCGNSTTGVGAGIYFNGGTPVVMNCTFVSNITGANGGGIYNDGGNLTVTNSIFYLNIINTGSVPSEMYGVTPADVTYCCIPSGNSTDFPGAGNIFSDPLFAGPGVDAIYGTEDDNLELQNGSLCIGAGTEVGAPAFDILEFPRSSSQPDLGAVENVLPKPVIYVGMYVGVGNNDGTTWDDAYTSLQSALERASEGSQIWVATGTYIPTEEFIPGNTRSKCFQMKDGAAMYGGFTGSETELSDRDPLTMIFAPAVLSGDIGAPGDNTDNCHHVVYSDGLDNTAILDGFIIRDGNTTGAPASYGGGIYNSFSSPVISNCTISYNHGSNGGGIANDNSSPEITGCTFTDNSANKGGGIYNTGSSPSINFCIFDQNNTTKGGGGIFNDNCSVAISQCIFRNNSATEEGGGIHNSYSSASIINCLFNGNISSMAGGGIYNEGNSPSITYCTFSSNSSSSGGGGMHNYESYPVVKNSIFWGNFQGDPSVVSEIVEQYDGAPVSSPDYTYSCIRNGSGTYTGTGNIFVDPKFVDADGPDDTFGNNDDDPSLQDESPCIGAGITIGAPFAISNDLSGETRGTPPDMGAIENTRDVPLPVELTSFTASAAGNGVILKWETATEVDNYGFEIERNTPLPLSRGDNKIVWEKIGFVEGNGISSSPKQYSFVDANPANGNVQYRLKQINTNGSFAYYKEIAEVNYSLTGVNEKQIPTEFALDQNYPNPFNPTTRIKYAVGKVSVGNNSNSSQQFVSLKIYDILGNEVTTLVNEHKAPGYYEVEFNGSNLATGVYIYRLTAGDFTSTKKLILMK